MESGFNCRRNRAELVAETDAVKANFNTRANHHRIDTEGDDQAEADDSSSAPFVVSE